MERTSPSEEQQSQSQQQQAMSWNARVLHKNIRARVGVYAVGVVSSHRVCSDFDPLDNHSVAGVRVECPERAVFEPNLFRPRPDTIPWFVS
jgi:hypothetical protein